MKSYLCVGGPWDGRKVAIESGREFAVAAPEHGDGVRAFKKVMYVEDVMNTPQGKVFLWVPQGQTPMETMALLLDTYERAKNPAQSPGRG